MKTQKQIYVKVMSPAETLFEGQAWAVSSRNSEGNFDVLADHANFITIIEDQPIIIRKMDQSIVTLKPKQSILYNVAGKVFIYTDPKVSR